MRQIFHVFPPLCREEGLLKERKKENCVTDRCDLRSLVPDISD